MALPREEYMLYSIMMPANLYCLEERFLEIKKKLNVIGVVVSRFIGAY